MKKKRPLRPKDSGFSGNVYFVICVCGRVDRFDVQMTRASLSWVKAHIGERCGACNRYSRASLRHLSPWQSEIDAMAKAAKWMTTDRRGVPPTCEELWLWLERNPVEPYESERGIGSDED